MAELERRLVGDAPGTGLAPDLASALPEAASYVLVVFDGLGTTQLEHPAAADLRASLAGTLHAPFPTTTTVSLATVATGLSPTGHGVIGHFVWLPGLGVVNTLKWISPFGERLDVDTSGFLPSPNLWERLAAAGLEPITVQPGDFAGSPLSRALYRGCRFEPVYGERELAEAVTDLAAEPGRLVFTYLPHVDFAAHVWGQASTQYADAMRTVAVTWDAIRRRLPSGAALVGTSDHGHLDYAAEDKILVRAAAYDDLLFWGDPRGLLVRGDGRTIDKLAAEVGATSIFPEDLSVLWGPGERHPELASRTPDRLLLSPEGHVLLPRGFDKRLTGYHGGLAPDEVEIPLLVG